VTDGAPGGSGTGLRGALAQLGASLLALLRTRLELAALEFDEVRGRTVNRLVLTLVALSFCAFTVLAASALVVVWFWDTHRIAALVGVTVFFLLVALAALWRLRAHQQASPPPFAATLAELERDRAWLADQLRREP
jgi:uncharacterized membrane protein YqjE